jgi:hypothetical protein
MKGIVHDPSSWKPPGKPRAVQVKYKVMTVKVVWPDDPFKRAKIDTFLQPIQAYALNQGGLVAPYPDTDVTVAETMEDGWI